jgi:hypothetical protein
MNDAVEGLAVCHNATAFAVSLRNSVHSCVRAKSVKGPDALFEP